MPRVGSFKAAAMTTTSACGRYLKRSSIEATTSASSSGVGDLRNPMIRAPKLRAQCAVCFAMWPKPTKSHVELSISRNGRERQTDCICWLRNSGIRDHSDKTSAKMNWQIARA
jgi:hypothetical protein